MIESKHKYLLNHRNDGQEFEDKMGQKRTIHNFIDGIKTACDYLKSELINRTQAWDKEKSESLTGIEPMTSQTPGGCSTT